MGALAVALAAGLSVTWAAGLAEALCNAGPCLLPTALLPMPCCGIRGGVGIVRRRRGGGKLCQREGQLTSLGQDAGGTHTYTWPVTPQYIPWPGWLLSSTMQQS